MSDVPPPDPSVWWDVDETTADALAILRLSGTDVDAARIRTLVPVAGQLINQFLDSPDPPTVMPDPVVQAHTYTVVELYRQKDSPPSSADDFGLSAGYVSADPLQPVRSMLAPYRRRAGVA